MDNLCLHCGGPLSIHQAETLKCPWGGMDQSGLPRPIWLDSVFLDKAILENVPAVIKRLIERIEQLEDQVSGILAEHDLQESIDLYKDSR